MKNIALKKGVCKICGCTANNPCYTPHDGYCWWTDETESICSHCKYDEIKNNKETVHCINDNPGWKPPKFIDKDGFECDSLKEITTEYETEIICPCCGHKPSTEDFVGKITAIFSPHLKNISERKFIAIQGELKKVVCEIREQKQ